MTVTLSVRGGRAAGRSRSGPDRVAILCCWCRGSTAISIVGTVASLQDSGQLPNGAEVTIIRGEYRAKLGEAARRTSAARSGFRRCRTEASRPKGTALAASTAPCSRTFSRAAARPASCSSSASARTPGQLADLAGFSPDLTIEQKVRVLETLDVETRLRLLIEWTRRMLAEASLKEKIRSEVNEGMEKTQRDFLLRQQWRPSRSSSARVATMSSSNIVKRMDEARMPEKVRAEVERELDRLERTSEQNPEHGLDPDVPRLDARHPVERPVRRQLRPATRAPHPR